MKGRTAFSWNVLFGAVTGMLCTPSPNKYDKVTLRGMTGLLLELNSKEATVLKRRPVSLGNGKLTGFEGDYEYLLDLSGLSDSDKKIYSQKEDQWIHKKNIQIISRDPLAIMDPDETAHGNYNSSAPGRFRGNYNLIRRLLAAEEALSR